MFHFQRTDPREVRPFGKELPEQSVVALIRPAFPGMVRSGEVDVDARGTGDPLMSGELFAIVERCRSPQAARQQRQLSRGRARHVPRPQALHFVDEAKELNPF